MILFSLVVCFIDLRQKHVFVKQFHVHKCGITLDILYLSYAGFVPQTSPLLVSLLEERKLACNSYYNYLAERVNQLRKTLEFTTQQRGLWKFK